MGSDVIRASTWLMVDEHQAGQSALINVRHLNRPKAELSQQFLSTSSLGFSYFVCTLCVVDTVLMKISMTRSCEESP